MTSFLPDVGLLTEQIAQAHVARERLDRVIAWLEEGVTLLGDAPVAPVPEIAAPKVPAKRRTTAPVLTNAVPASRVTARDVEAKVLSAVISSNQPLSRAQVAEHAGLTVAQVKNPLQRLVAAGKVHASGATVSRRYQAGEHEAHSEHGARAQAGRERSATKLNDAVARVGLRERVMRAIAADSGKLQDGELSSVLFADLGDIAEACDALVASGQVRRDGNGTYWRNASGRSMATA